MQSVLLFVLVLIGIVFTGLVYLLHKAKQQSQPPDLVDAVDRLAANPMRLIGKLMNAELNNADLASLPILLVLEAARKDGRPHLHGVFIGGGTPTLKVQHVMRRAVGHIVGRSGSRQFKAKNIYAPDGWVSYIHKDRKSTRKLLALSDDEHLSWISRPLTQLAHDVCEAVRLGRVKTSNSNANPRLLVI